MTALTWISGFFAGIAFLGFLIVIMGWKTDNAHEDNT